jgi:hypothetical protein
LAAEPQGQPDSVAAAVTEVSERVSLLVREEIELAKAEVTAKVTKLVKGAVVGIAAGIFLVTALLFALHGFAWLLYYELPIGNNFTYFWGFFVLAAILVVLGGLAGFIAARLIKRASPPTPRMAIDEAKLIRETMSQGSERS